MKTNHLISIVATGALLPLAAWAGDDAASKYSLQREAYDPRPSETRSGSPTPRVEDGRDQPSDRAAASDMRNEGTTALPPTGAGIERINSKEIEHRATASDLIGSKVVDREGQEVGKVKDIGLTAVAPQLAAQTEDSSARDRESRQSRANFGSTTDTSAVARPASESPGLRSGNGNPAANSNNEDPYLAEQRQRREVERAGTAGSRSDAVTTHHDGSSGRQWSQNPSSGVMADAQPRILVQPDRSLGLKGDLVAIPASRVHREGDTLRVDMSREELRAIVAQQDSRRVSMNE